MIEITTDNIEKEMKGTIIIDFWAEWCYPCKEIGPIFESLSKEMKNLKFGKLNVDDEPELAARFGVMSIPTFLLVKNGNEIGRFVGTMPKSAFKNKIEQVWNA